MQQLCHWFRRRLRLPPRGKLSSRRTTSSALGIIPSPSPAPSLDAESTASDSDTPKTARNVLIFALTTLSSVSSNIPFGGILSAVIDPLLAITKRIDQTSANTKGFVELAARVDLITPIVSQMAKDQPERGRKVVQALQRELESITSDLKAAAAQNRLSEFFNGEDNSSCLAKHNMALTQIIADATFFSIQEVLASLHDLERMRLEQSSRAEGPEGPLTELGDITGGLGGIGGHGYVGGEGGDGDGPELDIDLDDCNGMLKVGDISGGRGGTGGEGQQPCVRWPASPSDGGGEVDIVTYVALGGLDYQLQ
ncbi:hypothetical protein C8R46DRAFT_1359763 [Mycena filopes]|nr:hypothetical protein C8R46DRAFT_1359763 [Mycena filopes]